MSKPYSLIIDSGAISAINKGIKIDIDKYIQYIKDNQHLINFYLNLDVIGEGEQSYQNWVYMKKQGLDPLPVYHAGTDIKYLQRYLSEADYISIGAVASLSTETRAKHLDHMWSRYLVDKDGYPLKKIHGLGITTTEIMIRYPWYSLDSSTWIMTTRFGMVFAPKKRNGVHDYSLKGYRVYISSRSPSIKIPGKHFHNLSGQEQQEILGYFTDKGYNIGKSSFKDVPAGYILESNEKWLNKKKEVVEVREEVGLCNDYQLRDELNLIYFLDLAASCPPYPWAFKPERIGFGLIR